MKRANGFKWAAALALCLGGLLVISACGGDSKSEGDGDSDPTPDITSDLGDTIPDPSTEPPPDVADDTPADGTPDGLGDGEVGDPCTVPADCGGMPSTALNCLTDIYGMISFPGGYCSADCTSDDECGPSGAGTCVNAYVISLCLKNCTEASECRTSEGYECAELPSMLGIEGTFCLPAFEMPDMPPDASTDVYPEVTTDPPDDSTDDSTTD